jgi:hypothetical protein
MPDPRAAYNKEWRRTHPELVRARNRRCYLKRAEKNRAYAKKYHQENRDSCLASMKKWASENIEYRKTYQAEWYAKNREDQIRKHREATRALKARVLHVYGEVCACCGEVNWECLTIHHVNGGGTKHREAIKGYGSNFYKWLVRNNFPPGFQTLCFNCNCSRGLYGYCPHQGTK